MANRARELPASPPPVSRPVSRPLALPAPIPAPIDTFPLRPHHAIHRHRADTLAEAATRFQKRAAALEHATKILTRIRELKVLDTDATAPAGSRENSRLEFALLRDDLARLAREAPARPPRRQRIFGEEPARLPDDSAGAAGAERWAVPPGDAPTRPRGPLAEAGIPPALLPALAPDFERLDLSGLDRMLGELDGLRAGEEEDRLELEAAAQHFVAEAERAYPNGQAVIDSDTAHALTDGLRESILSESTLAMLAQANQASLPALHLLS
jgi:flagellin